MVDIIVIVVIVVHMHAHAIEMHLGAQDYSPSKIGFSALCILYD